MIKKMKVKKIKNKVIRKYKKLFLEMKILKPKKERKREKKND